MRYPASVLLVFFALVAPVMQVMAEDKGDDASRRIYAFEHRLLPRLVYGSEHKMFADLIQNQGDGLRTIAEKIVSPEFAQQMRFKTIVPDKAVLISFPEPEKPPLCYHVIVAKTDDGYAYHTLEKADDIANTGKLKAMYCSWDSPSTRKNFGGRGYTDADAFEKEYLANPDPKEAQTTLHLPARAEN